MDDKNNSDKFDDGLISNPMSTVNISNNSLVNPSERVTTEKTFQQTFRDKEIPQTVKDNV